MSESETSDASKTVDTSKTLWHGRFDEGPAAALEAYTFSIPFDIRLAADDIQGSRAHVRGLGRVGLLNEAEVSSILVALDVVENELERGWFDFQPADEDIHTAVERRVTELAPAGAKMHTGRSRNDQVCTDLRLFTKREMRMLSRQVLGFQEILFNAAQKVGDAYLPGYTHLQRAQPVPLAHHLMAHAWALSRDVVRLEAARTAADVSVLGAGALAGSSLPLDPASVAEDLGFSEVFTNSLDAVGNRDFVADALHAIALIGVHLSRIGEEFVLWSSSEFGFITLDDGYATGSSMMPQKKNADIAELARGKSGRLIGNLVGFLTTMKGLPMTYNRDLQEDKEPLFDGIDQISAGLVAVGGMIDTVTFNTDTMATAADDPMAGATDLAELLVTGGIPFREAHAIVGALVRDALRTGTSLITLVEQSSHFGPVAAQILAPGQGVRRRVTHGGAGLEPVAAQMETFATHLETSRQALAED